MSTVEPWQGQVEDDERLGSCAGPATDAVVAIGSSLDLVAHVAKVLPKLGPYVLVIPRR